MVIPVYFGDIPGQHLISKVYVKSGPTEGRGRQGRGEEESQDPRPAARCQLPDSRCQPDVYSRCQPPASEPELFRTRIPNRNRAAASANPSQRRGLASDAWRLQAPARVATVSTARPKAVLPVSGAGVLRRRVGNSGSRCHAAAHLQ